MNAEPSPVPVFLISLPRSGSTWLQRELCAAQPIASAPEPWVLLPLAYLARQGETLTPYNAFFSTRAEREMAQRDIPVADIWRDCLADTGRRFFRAMAGGAPYFLDKTPRNTLILPQIMAAFPEAKYIFLWRDPVGIARSILSTWGGRYDTLFRYRIDFEEGLANMAAAHAALPADRQISVCYETMRQDAGAEVARVLDFLGFTPGTRRSQEEIEAMLRSDLIGDQIYSGTGRSKERISWGSRRSIARMIDGIPEAFWALGRYDRSTCRAAVDAIESRPDPVNDALSAGAAFAYNRNLVGFWQKIARHRSNELGVIGYPME